MIFITSWITIQLNLNFDVRNSRFISFCFVSFCLQYFFFLHIAMDTQLYLFILSFFFNYIHKYKYKHNLFCYLFTIFSRFILLLQQRPKITLFFWNAGVNWTLNKISNGNNVSLPIFFFLSKCELSRFARIRNKQIMGISRWTSVCEVTAFGLQSMWKGKQCKILLILCVFLKLCLERFMQKIRVNTIEHSQ